MNHIKFRQPIFNRQGAFLKWHYWGFVEDGRFVGPETNSSTIEKAKATSQMFTGLQDKNGAAIYEGDIVDGVCILGDDYDKSQVIFKDAAFGLRVLLGRYEPCLYECDNRFLEVIGNVYENPDIVPAR